MRSVSAVCTENTMTSEACKAAQLKHCADKSMTGDFFGPRYSASQELYKKYVDPETLLAHMILYSIDGSDTQTVLVTGTKTTTERAAPFVPPFNNTETTTPLLKINLDKLKERKLFLVDTMLAEPGSVRFMSRAAGQSLLDLGVVESVEHLRYRENDETWNVADDFQVTRHAYSCNNANAGKSIGFHKDGEPSLSSHGIDTSLKIASQETTSGRFHSSFVVVSPLIRTWMTAVLLYAQSDKTLQLLVSPHLKEHLKFGVIEVGNMPKRVPHQVTKFTKFLTNDLGPDFARRPSIIKLLFPVRRQGGVAILSIQWTNDKWVVDREDEKTVKFDDYYGLSRRRLTSRRNASGPDAWHSSHYYRSNGSLRMFTAWWKKNQTQLDRLRGGPFLDNKIVHIVCHSQVMKAFCRTCPSSITSQNLWSMRYHHTPDDGMVLETYQEGADKPKPGAMTSSTRDPNQLNSLCGYSGSVSKKDVQAIHQQMQPDHKLHQRQRQKQG